MHPCVSAPFGIGGRSLNATDRQFSCKTSSSLFAISHAIAINKDDEPTIWEQYGIWDGCKEKIGFRWHRFWAWRPSVFRLVMHAYIASFRKNNSHSIFAHWSWGVSCSYLYINIIHVRSYGISRLRMYSSRLAQNLLAKCLIVRSAIVLRYIYLLYLSAVRIVTPATGTEFELNQPRVHFAFEEKGKYLIVGRYSFVSLVSVLRSIDFFFWIPKGLRMKKSSMW